MPAEPNVERESAPAAAKVDTAREAVVEEMSDEDLREAFDQAMSGGARAEEDDDGEVDEDPDEDPAMSKRARRKALREKAEADKKKTTSKAKDQDADDEDDDEDLDEELEDAEESDEDDDEEDEDEDEDETDYARALKVLALDGFTAEDLRDLSKQRVLALAEKAAKRQADVAKKLQRSAESTKKTESDKAGSRPEAEDGSDAATPKGLRVNPKRLKEVFDDSAADAIGGTIDEIATVAGQQLEAMREEFRSQLTELAMQNYRLNLSLRRPEIASALADERTWSRVVKRMAALKDVGEHDNADALADEAIAAVLKGRFSKTQSLRGQDMQPRAPGTNRGATRPMTEGEIEREIFDVSTNRNLSPSQRRRRLDRLSRRAMG